MSAQAEARIPSLDGLRGLAIGLVLLSHLSGSAGFSQPLVQLAGRVGYLGLRVFFIITGFLVTLLLLREWEKQGRIDLAKFWFRRIFRLLPAAVMFLASVYTAGALGYVQLEWPRDFVYPLTFTMNYYSGRDWFWVHLWSLSDQIQFYLVWPLLLVAAGKGRILYLSLAVILLAPLVRILTFNVLPVWYTQGHTFETTIDMFAVGSLMAVLRKPLGDSKKYMHFIHSPAMLGLVVLTFAMHYLTRFGKPALILTGPLCLALAVLIDRSTRITTDWWGRFVAWRPVVFLGTISYSLYIWQQPFINHGTPLRFPVSLLLALLTGTIVYFAVERPFANLGRRIHSTTKPSTSTYAPAAISEGSETRTV